MRVTLLFIDEKIKFLLQNDFQNVKFYAKISSVMRV